MGLAETPKFPIRMVGPRGNQTVQGLATLQFAGSGLVGTMFGIPGMSATRIATGVYDLRFPTVRSAVIMPAIEDQSPSGVNMGNLFDARAGFPNTTASGAGPGLGGGVSGMARLYTTRSFVTPSGGAAPTAFSSPINPPTGSVVNMLLIGSPITAY